METIPNNSPSLDGPAGPQHPPQPQPAPPAAAPSSPASRCPPLSSGASSPPLSQASPPPLPQAPVQPPQAPPPPTGRAGPLGEAELLLVRQASARYKAVKSASRTALVSAIVTLVIGFSSLPFVALSPSWDGILVVVGVCAVGAVEYKGYKRLRRADPSAARFLGRNQLAFLALIAFYCAVQMITFWRGGTYAALLSPGTRAASAEMPEVGQALDSTMAPYARLMPLLIYGFYGLVIVASIFSQGGLALYYFTRRRRLEAFTRETPEWVRRLFIETTG